MEDSAESRFAAEAAHAVIRKFFASLHKVVVEGGIPMKFYSRELIDQSTLNIADQHDKATRILLDVQKKISQSMGGGLLDNFCRILREENSTLTSLVQAIQGNSLMILPSYLHRATQ